jgi:SAM-dependent methyltransferase
MVVEHLADPDGALREIYRVLRPGGLFIFHTPNVRSPIIRLARAIPFRLRTRLVSFIDGRHEDDVFPTYYRLNKADSILSVAEKNGFLVSSFAFVETSPVFAMLGPLVLFELLAILLLRNKTFAHLRPDLIVVLQKPLGAPLVDKSVIAS